MKSAALVIILLIFACNASPLIAQDAVTGIGISGGLVGGTGLSVRMLPDKGFGYHVGALYIETSDRKWGSFGVEPLMVLRRTMNTSVYVVGGIGYMVNGTRERWAVGAGFGYGWNFYDDLWCSVDLLLTRYNGQVLPYPQLAVHYFVW